MCTKEEGEKKKKIGASVRIDRKTLQKVFASSNLSQLVSFSSPKFQFNLLGFYDFMVWSDDTRNTPHY